MLRCWSILLKYTVRYYRLSIIYQSGSKPLACFITQGKGWARGRERKKRAYLILTMTYIFWDVQWRFLSVLLDATLLIRICSRQWMWNNTRGPLYNPRGRRGLQNVIWTYCILFIDYCLLLMVIVHCTLCIVPYGPKLMVCLVSKSVYILFLHGVNIVNCIGVSRCL